MLRIILTLAMASSALLRASEARAAAPDACHLVNSDVAAAALKMPLARTIAQSYGSMHGCAYRSAGTTTLLVTIHPRNSPGEAKVSMRSMIAHYGMAAHSETDAGLGDEATSAGRILFVRKNDTIYTFEITAQIPEDECEAREVAVARASLR